MNLLDARLSKRERDAILGMVAGLPRAEIVDTMRIATQTLGEYQRRIRKKLGARTNYQAVAIWVRGELARGDALQMSAAELARVVLTEAGRRLQAKKDAATPH